MATAARTAPAEARALAARVVTQVGAHNRYLDAALEETLGARPVPARAAALIQELSYGVLRWYHQLAAVARLLLEKPLGPKDRDVEALLLVGLYQLRHMRVARHAAVSETVAAAARLRKPWGKNLINACLREYLRHPERAQREIENNPAAALSHPAWLLEELRRSWPREWEAVARANNERPPLVLRVNLRKNSRAEYLARLAAAGLDAAPTTLSDAGVILPQPAPVARLPGFADGCVSVQDEAAQLAAILLDAQPGERVLDACAAPGGKAAHILERAPGPAELMALEADPARAGLIGQNLARLGLKALVVVGDAGAAQSWWDGRPFDRILLDAPCSATGVIRRHPDIKLRRQPADIPRLIQAQARLLDGLWPLLRRGGKLLYVTCSILPGENEDQLRAFRDRRPDAAESALTGGWGRARPLGRQILPGERGMDGFYYGCLKKS